MKTHRVWLDSLTANSLCVKQLAHIITNNWQIVTSTNAVDNLVFQRHLDWLEMNLTLGTVAIELWDLPNEMVQKPFFWSSCSKLTNPAETLEEAVKDLPNAGSIVAVAFLAEQYGLTKSTWTMGPWEEPAQLSQKTADLLGLDPATATRSDVLVACKESGSMCLFDEYNRGYCRGLAKQHGCQAIINSDGSLTLLEEY